MTTRRGLMRFSRTQEQAVKTDWVALGFVASIVVVGFAIIKILSN
jgi:hypothetical protein